LALNSSSLRRLKIEGNSFTPYREMESEKERELPVCSQALLTKLLLLFTGKQTVISESELSLSCAPWHP
jgi:hypothetical protein